MKPFLIGLAIGVFLLFLFINFGSGFRPEQPISFNHKKHQEQGIECTACHSYFNEQTFSGMPKTGVCMECHKDSVTKHPDEEKIRQFQKKGEEIYWIRLYRQPDHVFFSHSSHVALAGMGGK